MRPFSIRRMMLVIAALAFLFALFAISEREAQRLSWMGGRRGKCASNLHNVALAVLRYENDNGVFPTGTWPNPDLEPADRLSWYALVLRELDSSATYDALKKSGPWNAGMNDVFAHENQRMLRCPSGAGVPAGSAEPTSYVSIAGLDSDAPLLPKSNPRAGVFGYDRKTTMADITDGASNTMMLAETGRVSGSWLQGGPPTVRGLDRTRKPYVGTGRQFGGLHGAGAYVAMADGSVRWISDSISPRIFEACSTMAGGESLPGDW